MIKVVEAISDTNIGGAGILLVNRLKNTTPKVFDTWVILPQDSLLISKIKSTGVHVLTLKVKGDRSFDVCDIFKYFLIIKRIAPDIINAHGCMSARIAARMANVPVRLYTRHCVYPTKKIYKISIGIQKIYE